MRKIKTPVRYRKSEARLFKSLLINIENGNIPKTYRYRRSYFKENKNRTRGFIVDKSPDDRVNKYFIIQYIMVDGAIISSLEGYPGDECLYFEIEDGVVIVKRFEKYCSEGPWNNGTIRIIYQRIYDDKRFLIPKRKRKGG